MPTGPRRSEQGEPEKYGLFLGGSQKSGQVHIDITCPANGEFVARCAAATETEVGDAVAAAASAFELGVWSAQPARARARVLHKIADALEARVDELARLDALCTGRPLRELAPQVGRLPEWFRYFAGIVEGFEGSVLPFAGNYLNYTDRVPLGVVAQIVTWNHPLLLLVKKLAPALVTGNSVVVKPSELTPATAVLLAETCYEAGVPENVLNVVPGLGAETGRALVGSAGLAKIDFTGGTETGRAIARAAAENLVPATLELGGKTPVLVFPDTELEQAVSGCLFSAFVAAGQTCVSGARLIVHDDIHDAFVERFTSRAASLTVGHPLDPETQIGSLVSARQQQHVLEYIALGREEGATLVTGGGVPEGLPEPLANGAFVEPTVFTDVRPDMRIARDEIFGPVVCVIRVSTEEEAVRIANDAEFGLGAAVWTRDVARAHRVARSLRSGVVWINDHHRNDPSSPWGGFRSSGYGRENGWESLYAYTAPRSVVVNLSDEPFDWFSAKTAQRYG